MRALLLSAYHTNSHRRWADGLMQHVNDSIDWTLLSLAGRHFPWRIRGNPLSWMQDSEEVLRQDYDTIVATSMVDLSTLIGLYPHMGRAHKVLYCHENQFEYPLSETQKRRAEPLMVSLYAALAADRVLFNSEYNRRTFLEGAWTFLRRMPERVDAAVVDRVAAKAVVLPVPLAPVAAVGSTQREPGLLLWNHRWEYDKNPEDFFAACELLKRDGVPFRLAVVGQTFRQQPPVFAQAAETFRDHIVAWGFQARADYRHLLWRASIVVSTAWHEFQGLSVMEAVQAGCVPLVPDRVCYPELYDERYRYDGSPEHLADCLSHWLRYPELKPAAPDTAKWEWTNWKTAYQKALVLPAWLPDLTEKENCIQ